MTPDPTRRTFLNILTGAAIGAAAGCQQSPRDRSGRTELNFYTYATPEFLRLYTQDLIPAFERAHPKIKVRITTSLGDAGYDAKLLTLIAGGIAPDVFHVTQANFASYAGKNLLLPLDDFARRDSDFSFDSIYANVLNGMRIDGTTLGLPSDFSTIVMLYNQDLFDRYGVEYPQPEWTWDDYLAKAKALTHDTDGDGYLDTYGTANPSQYNRWPAWVWMNGGDILSPDRKRCVLDSPEAIGGLQFYADLSTRHRVAPTPTTAPEMDSERLQGMFGSGNIAMLADSRYIYKRHCRGRGLPFRWDVAPMPRGKSLATTFIWGGNCVLKNTKHPRESWELVKFITGAEGAAVNRAAGNALPAHKAAAEDEIAHPHWANTPAHDRYFIDAISYGRVAPFPAQYAEYMQAVNGIFDAFLPTQRKPVDQVCREFAAKVNEALQGEVS